MSHEYKPKPRTAPKTDDFHRILVVANDARNIEVHDPVQSVLDKGYVLDEEASKGNHKVYKLPLTEHKEMVKAAADKGNQRLRAQTATPARLETDGGVEVNTLEKVEL